MVFKICCVPKCSNTSKSLDPRTEKKVKFHGFPNAYKDEERCLRWITNIGRADLHLGNAKFKVICSIHFHPKAYNNPKDISASLLLPSAVPTPEYCSNPPKPLTASQPSKEQNIVVCSILFLPTTYNNPNDISASLLLPSAVPTPGYCLNPPKPLTASQPSKEQNIVMYSVDFHPTTYNNPKDISAPLLLPSAVPTPEYYLKPTKPLTPSQPSRKRKVTDINEETRGDSNTAPSSSCDIHSPCKIKVQELEEKLLKVKNALQNFQKVSRELKGHLKHFQTSIKDVPSLAEPHNRQKI